MTEAATKSTRFQPILDKRIATLLREEEASRDEIMSLWHEAWDEFSRLKAFIESELKRLLDLENTNPSASQDAIERAKLADERLTIAMREFKARIEVINRKDYAATWDAEYEAVVAERDGLVGELLEADQTIRRLADLFHRIETFDKARLGPLHLSAPAGESRRLLGVELTAYAMDHFTLESPSITKNLKLPDPSNPNKLLYPHDGDIWNSYAATMVAATQAMERQQLGFGPDWHEAGKLRDEERRAEIAKVEEEEKARQAKSQQDYYDAMRRHEAARLGIKPNVNGGAGQ